MPRPLLGLVLTVVYVLSGMLGLLLAVPPGYATAIFPPAGIAVGLMLIAGRVTLPWTFLGSLLLNLWTAYFLSRHIGALDAVVAVVIATASTVQAALGGTLLRRVVGYPAALDNARDLARFVWLPPLFCVTSATLSLSAMALLGAIAAEDLVSSWLTWWIGDTLGVLLVLPLLLVAAGEPRALWRSRARSVAVPMLIFFVLFVAIFVRVRAWEKDQSLLEFRMLSQRVIDHIQARLDEQDVFLHMLERSFSGPTPVSQQHFHRLVDNIKRRFADMQAVEWAPRVTAANRAAFEDAQRARDPGFAIREPDPNGGERAAGARPVYYPVAYLEPLAGNEEAVGLDLASEPARNAAISAAFASGRLTATAPVRLVQDHASGYGMLLTYAVPDGAAQPGIVLTVLRMGAFMQSLRAGTEGQLAIALDDTDAGVRLYESAHSIPHQAEFMRAFDFGARHYLLRATPTAAYWRTHRAWQSWAVLVIGVFSTGLLGALLMLATGDAHRSEELVEARTRDLQVANQRLLVEIQEREHAEAALRQAQRMEAIGQLTGGIAHDFNNLLMVVTSNAELLRRYGLDERGSARVASILQATERGERLTRQLLTFSRRQVLHPETLDLRQVAREIADMLSRSLRADIAVTTDIAEDLLPVAVDRGELELALLNIGVNARDAMPGGGTLRMTAHNVRLGASGGPGPALEGDFVALTLIDNGTGMTPEVAAQAFEPFFTTKEVGQGSGLGLSQVYGFAQQSGGMAVISSERGRGTAITLFLPVASGPERAAPMPQAAAKGGMPRIRVLLVEDDAEVAAASLALLRELGCEAEVAGDSDRALAALERGPDVDLLISDIVMPGAMNGIDLARLLRGRRPELPIVLATGYSQYAREVASEGFILLEKPYRLDALARAIEAALSDRRTVHAV